MMGLIKVKVELMPNGAIRIALAVGTGENGLAATVYLSEVEALSLAEDIRAQGQRISKN